MIKDADELNFVRIYAKAWNILDSEVLFPYLSENVVYESQNVFEPLTGKDKVLEYLRAKMLNIKNGGLKNKVYAEIGYCDTQSGNSIQLHSTFRGSPAVVMAQGKREVPIALVLLKVTDNLIERIDICSVAPHPLSALRTGEYPD